MATAPFDLHFKGNTGSFTMYPAAQEKEVTADVETWHDAVPEDGPVFPAPAPAAPAMITRRATINVLPIHIVNGIRGNVYVDPCGLAIKDSVLFSRQVRVSTVDIAFTIGHLRNETVEHTRHVVETPAEVAAWLARWDAGKEVKPIFFTLSWQEAE